MTEETYYNYDEHGNMTSKYTDTLGAPTGAISDSVSVLKENSQSTVELYDYDAFNRLITVRKGGTTASYTYNDAGLRTSKTVNGQKTTFILDGINVIAETNSSGQATHYIRGLQLIFSIDSNNVKKYYTYNGHGDTTNLTDSTGTVIQTYAYDAFGVEIGADPNDTNPFRYCAEYFDKETGDIYLRTRYYSPSRGRFNAQDPAMYGDNWYVYCGSNPVMFWDPLGLKDNYIFYNPNNINAADVAATAQIQLENPDDVVILVEVTSEEEFKEGMEGMSDDVGTVVIIFDGEPEKMVIDEDNGEYVTSETLDSLAKDKMKDKTIDTIFLVSCNTGNMNYIDTNMASQFATKLNVTRVIAPDGYEYTWGGEYKSVYNDPDNPREGNGFVLYERRGNMLCVTTGVSKDSEKNLFPIGLIINRAMDVSTYATDIVPQRWYIPIK